MLQQSYRLEEAPGIERCFNPLVSKANQITELVNRAVNYVVVANSGPVTSFMNLRNKKKCFSLTTPFTHEVTDMRCQEFTTALVLRFLGFGNTRGRERKREEERRKEKGREGKRKEKEKKGKRKISSFHFIKQPKRKNKVVSFLPKFIIY